jgi:hypothetical protein
MQIKLNSDAASGLSSNDINTVLNKITNTKNYYLQQINSEISKIDIILSSLNETDIIIEYDNYLSDLENELNSVKTRIANNNTIIGRQQNNYDNVNIDYSDIIHKQKKVKELEPIKFDPIPSRQKQIIQNQTSEQNK